MASPVKPPSNHYETLGIQPTANDDEVAQAFDDQIRLFRLRPRDTVAHLAELNLAFDTLRDPVKRRAYDTSLRRKPKAVAGVVASDAARFIGTSRPRFSDCSRRPTPQPRGQTGSEAPAELRLASFIAASLREPVKQREPNMASGPTSQPDQRRVPGASAEAGLAPVGESSAIEDDERSIETSRATLAAGVLGLGILALALWLPKQKVDRVPGASEQVRPTMTIGLPPATPVHDSGVLSKVPARAVVDKQREQSALSGNAGPARGAPLQPSPSSGGRQPQEIANGQAAAASPPAKSSNGEVAAVSRPLENTTESSVEAAPVATGRMKLVLPDATIARTIERIGYACGRVVSTAAVEAAIPGVYKVTCSSGHSYQATPVRGRYHFRRWGSH